MDGWGWIAGAGAAALAIIGVLAKLADIPKIIKAIKKLFVRLRPQKEFKLRDAKQVYKRIDGAVGAWRRNDDLEVLVEVVVASTQEVRNCLAELDTKSGYSYYQAIDHGQVALFHIQEGDNLVQCKFYIPLANFPARSELRLRSGPYISNWVVVDWPYK